MSELGESRVACLPGSGGSCFQGNRCRGGV